MPPKQKKLRTGLSMSEDKVQIKELVSLPIAPGLLFGDRSHALRMYREADRGRIRSEIERLVPDNLKILSFEDTEKIGRCNGHPWGNLAAARVINLSKEKQCILVTLYDDEECSATFAIKSSAQRANWKIVDSCNF